MNRNPVLVAMSILAGMQALISAAGFTEALPAQVALWIVLAVAALQAGVQFYVRGEVTPLVDPRDNDGRRLVPEPEPGADGYEGRHRTDPSE